MGTLIASAVLVSLVAACAGLLVAATIYARVAAATSRRPASPPPSSSGRRPMFESFSALCAVCGGICLTVIVAAAAVLTFLPTLSPWAYIAAVAAGAGMTVIGMRQARKGITA